MIYIKVFGVPVYNGWVYPRMSETNRRNGIIFYLKSVTAHD